jgi:pimeloyl-ACP methyl ester carboxylesterase
MIQKAYADTPLGQLHYREAGSGSPLVLLHQTASSSAMYERALPQLAARHRAIALDTPGFGMSDPPPERPRTCDHYARAVVALLDFLELDRAALVGFHTGATIALEVAAAYPERASAIALVGLLAIEDDEHERQWSWILKPYTPDLDGRFLDFHMELLRMYVHEDDPEMLLTELAQRLVAGTEYWWAYEAVLTHRAYERLPLVRCPVLFVNPTGDMLIEETKRAHARTPGSFYAEMPGDAGAVMQFPREFADTVARFVAAHAG